MAATKKENAPPPSEPDTAGDAAESSETPESKPGLLGNRKRLVIIGGAVLMLAVVGGGAAFFLGGGKSAAGESGAESAEAAPAEEKAPAEGEGGGEGEGGELPLVDVPPMLVNLRTADGSARYLKLHFMLEAPSTAKADKLKARLPAILDAYQPFLRELRPEDIAGSAAVFRIKEEMLIRATQVAGRGMVRDVLIQELVQQ